MNRRSEKLDKYLSKRVQITFYDGDVETGVLEFGRPYYKGGLGSNEYSITEDNDTLFFRKSHVKSIKEESEERE